MRDQRGGIMGHKGEIRDHRGGISGIVGVG